MATEVKEISSLTSSTKSIFGSGFTTGLIGLFILAGGIPIPPFSYLGYGGLNLWAAGSLQWCMAKASFQGAMVFLHAIITSSYPQLKWIGYLLILNPWYIFDIVQIFSPAFAYEGFKLPLTKFDPIKPLIKPQADGKGGFTYSQATLSIPLILSAVALTCTGIYGFLNMLPASLARNYKPIVNTIFTVLGSLTAVLGGGIGSAAAIPHIMSFLNSNTKGAEAESEVPRKQHRPRSQTGQEKQKDIILAPPLETLTASSPMAISENNATIAAITDKIIKTDTITPTIINAPTESILASAPYASDENVPDSQIASAPYASDENVPDSQLASAPQSSSNEYLPETLLASAPIYDDVQRGGAVLPPLRDVISSILKKNTHTMQMQSGGGRSVDDVSKYIFLGSLAFITVSGIGLALIRSKRLYMDTI